jgi:crotonobetainyl-CoA:carnitine CoA-transferase CaiB-like acyl-CoA transferase
VAVLNAAGVPCGPINDIGEAFEDPQVKHLRMAKAAPHPHLGDLMLVRSPINLSAFPEADRFDRAAPDPGADSAAVLAELGLDAQRIRALQSDGVI